MLLYFKRIFLCINLISISATVHGQDYMEIRRALEQVHQSDQQLRVRLDSMIRKANLEWIDPAVQSLLPQIARQDSANMQVVAQVLDQYGWPGTKAIGDKANEAVFLVIQHADSTVMQRYFPLLAMSCETGESPRRFYAMMLDRMLTERGRPQVFGTQISTSKHGGKYLLFPVAATAQLNQRRRYAGLPELRRWMEASNLEMQRNPPAGPRR